ncbi:hypothetical protein [Lachnoclostridium phytofermentans]|uniref:Uncharacterized protein n=1 Tax=Lachnoclostridium phytofermentans (strain ATCC 700394 / DSM 18823 / ISDg) TaxID=357809 RepID=A9KLE4_LACP7|nr:hypothetical protein [Lachnoclostridium phytofermentans]ABX41273.1 hypothetical protein Cphy_0887 [Lachnoclostridium phytofermentans ISDg]
MNTDWMNNESLRNMHPYKKQVMLELIKESQGLSMERALPNLMKANSKLKAMSMDFTPQEVNVITDLLTANMSPADKMKLEMLKKMMPNR